MSDNLYDYYDRPTLDSFLRHTLAEKLDSYGSRAGVQELALELACNAVDEELERRHGTRTDTPSLPSLPAENLLSLLCKTVDDELEQRHGNSRTVLAALADPVPQGPYPNDDKKERETITADIPEVHESTAPILPEITLASIHAQTVIPPREDDESSFTSELSDTCVEKTALLDSGADETISEQVEDPTPIARSFRGAFNSDTKISGVSGTNTIFLPVKPSRATNFEDYLKLKIKAIATNPPCQQGTIFLGRDFLKKQGWDIKFTYKNGSASFMYGDVEVRIDDDCRIPVFVEQPPTPTQTTPTTSDSPLKISPEWKTEASRIFAIPTDERIDQDKVDLSQATFLQTDATTKKFARQTITTPPQIKFNERPTKSTPRSFKPLVPPSLSPRDQTMVRYLTARPPQPNPQINPRFHRRKIGSKPASENAISKAARKTAPSSHVPDVPLLTVPTDSPLPNELPSTPMMKRQPETVLMIDDATPDDLLLLLRGLLSMSLSRTDCKKLKNATAKIFKRHPKSHMLVDSVLLSKGNISTLINVQARLKNASNRRISPTVFSPSPPSQSHPQPRKTRVPRKSRQQPQPLEDPLDDSVFLDDEATPGEPPADSGASTTLMSSPFIRLPSGKISMAEDHPDSAEILGKTILRNQRTEYGRLREIFRALSSEAQASRLFSPMWLPTENIDTSQALRMFPLLLQRIERRNGRIEKIWKKLSPLFSLNLQNRFKRNTSGKRFHGESLRRDGHPA